MQRAIRSNGISQSRINHQDDGSTASPFRVGAKQDTLERQDSSVSPQIDDSAHEYVPFGTHNTGDGQGQSDENIDLEDVDNIDNNDDDEGAYRESVHSWVQGTGGMGMVERRHGVEDALREFDNTMAPRTDSTMAQCGDEKEPSDVEMEE